MNKVELTGRLTRDPDIRFSTNKNGEDTTIARYTLAIDRRSVREGEQSADFISCVAFGKNGEFADKFLNQGIKIGVVGRLQSGSYTNKDGQKIYYTEVVVEEQEFEEPKKSQSGEHAERERTTNDDSKQPGKSKKQVVTKKKEQEEKDTEKITSYDDNYNPISNTISDEEYMNIPQEMLDDLPYKV